MKPGLNQSVAGSLVCAMVLNTLSWMPLAFAESPRTSQLTYTFTTDIPNHGVIDLYHNAYSLRDRVSNSLYLLRNTAVEDLLNTRRSLKILLGGTERARRVSGKHDIGFDVPGGVVDLYLLGNLGEVGQNNATSAGASHLLGPIQTGHGIDTDSVPEIANSIHWLGSHDPQYDEALRTRLLTGLVYVSAQLTKFDQQLKFLQKDFWDNRAIDQEFHESEMSTAALGVDKAGPESSNGSSGTYLQLKSDWLTRHGMNDVLSTLAGHREYLLDRYHLLGIEVDGKPLYQVIYKAMESVGFPRAEMAQSVVTAHLPGGTELIPLPTEFETTVERSINTMMGTSQNQILSELNLDVNSKIDQALLSSLEANTERLNALTSVIDYDGSRSSPLLELARYEDLWSTATQKYGYILGIVDMSAAQAEIAKYLTRRDTTTRHLRYTAIGVGVGIGVVAVALTGGIAAEGGAAALEGSELLSAATGWGSIPLRSWLIGSGMITDGALSGAVYVDSQEAAKVAKGLFLGTSKVSSYSHLKGALEMRESDFHLLIGSLISLGLGTTQLVRMAAVRTVFEHAGQTFVRISSEELASLRQAVTSLGERAEALAPLGRALLTAVRSLLRMTTGLDGVMPLEDAIPMIARQMKMAPAAVMARLEANPIVGSLIKGCRLRGETARLMGRPTFLRTMVEQQGISAAVSVVVEGGSRGKHLLTDEFGDFVNDMAQGALVTFALVYIGSPTSAPGAAAAGESQAAGAAGRVKIQGGFFNENPLGQFLKSSGQTGMQNFVVGFSVNAATTSIGQTIEYVQNSNTPHSPSASDRAIKVLKNAAYGGVFMGVSSNLRYQGYSWLQNNISRYIQSEPTAKIVLAAATAGNNLFGGWHYVKIAKMIGVMKDGGSAEPADEANTDANHPLDSHITGLQLEDLGGAYFRVDGDQTGAAYMFDFLRGGNQAGTPPVAN